MSSRRSRGEAVEQFDACEARGNSGRVLAQVVETTWYVADEPEQDVHRRGLHVTPGLPPGKRVPSEVQELGERDLSEVEPLADRADLVRGEKAVLLPVERERAFAQVSHVVEPENDLAALRAAQVNRVGNRYLLSVDREVELGLTLAHARSAGGAGAGGQRRDIGRSPLRTRLLHRRFLHLHGTRRLRIPIARRASRRG